jgi:ectoine hydroxylase-related dioxygenase (phytanoyl-CoA dioxygenase family)
MRLEKHPASVTGTYANRMVHAPTDQLVIGPHLIDLDGNVRTFDLLASRLLTATCQHPFEPDQKVLFLTMNGRLIEADVESLETRELFDLVDELCLPDRETWRFKGAHAAQGRVVVANNSYDERDFGGSLSQGRLAEWDGTSWTVVEEIAHSEVTERRNWDELVFATGWDRRSAVLSVRGPNGWRRYRLPKASHAWYHYWQTEWPRIREVESERYLMDCHALFYELSPVPWDGGKIWGVRPSSTHLRIIPDFCARRGMLVLGGNQQTPMWDTNLVVGDAESNLWFDKTDDLWRFGKPKGWGGVWWGDQVEAGVPSDAYLMTGFDGKVLHLAHETSTAVAFTVEVDFSETRAGTSTTPSRSRRAATSTTSSRRGSRPTGSTSPLARPAPPRPISLTPDRRTRRPTHTGETMATLATDTLNYDSAAFFDHGYVVIADVIERSELAEVNRSLDEKAKHTINQTRGFVNERELLKDKRFFDIFTQPRIVETVRGALGDDIQILDLAAMEDPPGTGAFRSWHNDYHESFPIVERPPLMVTLLVYLADMVDERGPLYVRPGSHKLLRHPDADERGTPFPDEVKVAVAGGTAVAFHSNLWHSGSTNATAEPRRLLFSLWSHYWIKRLDEFYETPLPEFVAEAEDPLIRQLFGVATAAPSVHGRDYNAIAYGG